MATYIELRQLFGQGDLLNKIEVACVIAAEAVRTEDAGTTNHANRLIWAKRTFSSPRGVAEQMMMAILAANNALSVAQITGSSDSAIQTKVDAAVDLFADGS